MNILYPPSNPVIAKTCGCKNVQKVTYEFAGDFYSMCVDKKDLIRAHIQACETLLKLTKDASEWLAVQKEITDLKMALDLLHEA